MLLIYYGPDTYLRAEALQQLKAELDTDGMLATNTVTLDGARVALAELCAICDTVPFLAARRLVIVTDLLARGQASRPRARGGRTRAESPGGEDLARLLDYVPRLPPTTILLLQEGALREDNALLQALRPLGEVRAFRQLGPEEVAGWIRQRAAARGASVEPRAVRALAELAGANLWVLAGELEKLALYAAGRGVTEEDVRRMVAAAQESNVFSMVDAIVDGRLDLALRQLRLLQQGGAAGPYLLTMIAWRYRQLLVVDDLMRAGQAPAAIARAAEIRSDNALHRLQQQARRRGPIRLQAAHERILAADLTIKRGEADEETALELLVGELATA